LTRIVGSCWEHDPRGADREGEERREVARVAEEELRHGQDDVVLADAENALRVPLAAEDGAVRRMDGRLWLTCAPGRELPDRDVVLGGRSGVELVGHLPQPLLIDDQHLAQPAARLRHLADRPFRRLVDDHDAGTRVVEVVRVVLRLEEGVGLGRDRSDLLRPVPECDELDRVGEHEQDALLGAYAQLPEEVAAAVYEPGQLGVGRRAARTEQRRPVAPALLDVAVDEPAREVEFAREVLVGDHATSRISSTSMSARASNVCSPSSAVASAGAPAYAWSIPIATKLV
jgi:hypothetical protein